MNKPFLAVYGRHSGIQLPAPSSPTSRTTILESGCGTDSRHGAVMPLFSPFFRLPGRWTRRRTRKTRMAIQIIALLVFILVVVPFYIIYKPPKFVIGLFQQRFPEVLFQIDTSKKIIALTIDDAPSEYTRPILDILNANYASATFFVIGNQVPGRENVLIDILKAGSELGNHAMHDEPSISLSSDKLVEEITQVDQLIDTAHRDSGITRQSRYFRPGSGVFSRRILDVAAKAKYRTVLGSIYPHDPFISIWWINAWHILSMFRPGAVIICHDRRPWTVPMLAKVIPRMKKKGYQVVSISRFLEISNQ